MPHLDNQIAVLIPCFNESKTLKKVITDCKKSFPHANVYVYDNGSTDDSVAIATRAGAFVKVVHLRGKGQVVRRLFADVEASIFILIDADATYDIEAAHNAITLLQTQNLDMVVCTRKASNKNSFPKGHVLGNYLFTMTVNALFGKHFTDIFSGFRIFSRRFIKSFPAISQGFDIEAEMTIHALQLGLPAAEVETIYHARPDGSQSKLHPIKDGLRILKTIITLFIYVKPFVFFGILFCLFSLVSLFLGIGVTIEFIHTGLVARLPTAVLAASLSVLASLSLACGIILNGISHARLETKRFWYLFAEQMGNVTQLIHKLK